MIARIYRPRRGATQSGFARTKAWLLEIERTEPPEIEPLMGWTGSSETEMQVKVSFDTREEAVAYAEKRVDSPTRSKSTRPRPSVADCPIPTTSSPRASASGRIDGSDSRRFEAQVRSRIRVPPFRPRSSAG